MRGELLKITKKQRIRYESHFLNSVHCQLTVAPMSAELILEKELEILNGLSFMKISKTAHLNEGSWKFRAPSQPNQPPLLEGGQHRVSGLKFIAESPRLELEISGSTILYSEYQYSGFEDFSDNLLQIITCVASALNIQKLACIGLRKINTMHVGPIDSMQDAVSAFNPALFGTAKCGIAETQSIKIYESSLTLQKNNYACLIKHRLRNLEEGKRFEIILDFDLLDQNDTDINSGLAEKLNNLNDTSFDLFSWAVGDELTKIMKPISQGE